MNYAILLVIATILIAGFSFNSVHAASFMHIADLPGESTDLGHQEWINIESLKFSIKQTGSDSSAQREASSP
jgi:hypothetical protein